MNDPNIFKNSKLNRTRECPSCAVEVDKDAEVCPICGYEFPTENKLWRGIVWIVAVLLLLYIYFYWL